MIKEEKNSPQHRPKSCHCHSGGSPSPLYGLGIVGALFYFLQGATTLSTILIGIVKSIFWPAFVLYKILILLQI